MSKVHRDRSIPGFVNLDLRLVSQDSMESKELQSRMWINNLLLKNLSLRKNFSEMKVLDSMIVIAEGIALGVGSITKIYDQNKNRPPRAQIRVYIKDSESSREFAKSYLKTTIAHKRVERDMVMITLGECDVNLTKGLQKVQVRVGIREFME